jgi:hypothetical protein
LLSSVSRFVVLVVSSDRRCAQFVLHFPFLTLFVLLLVIALFCIALCRSGYALIACAPKSVTFLSSSILFPLVRYSLLVFAVLLFVVLGSMR